MKHHHGKFYDCSTMLHTLMYYSHYVCVVHESSENHLMKFNNFICSSSIIVMHTTTFSWKCALIIHFGLNVLFFVVGF